jgi:hypothetical protein
MRPNPTARSPFDRGSPTFFLALLSPFPILLALAGGLFHEIGNNATLAFMLAGSLVICTRARLSRDYWIGVAVLAVILRWVYFRITGPPAPYFGSAWIQWGSFLGLASLVILGLAVLRSQGEERRHVLSKLLTASILPYTWVLIGFSLPLTKVLRPGVYDAFLCAFDGTLGFQPSFLLGQLLPHNHALAGLTGIIYYALPLPVSFVFAFPEHRNTKRVALFISMMVAGFCLYSVFPATGPIYAFHALFPFSPPDPAAISLGTLQFLSAPRNAMPSLHLGAALLVWWNSRGWRTWGRALAGFFLLATAFATMALGEHYLIDLVVAFPFVLVFQAAWSTSVPLRSPDRRRPIAAAILMVIAWFLLLRFGIPQFLGQRGLSWGCVLATVGGCVWLEWRLAMAATVRYKTYSPASAIANRAVRDHTLTTAASRRIL